MKKKQTKFTFRPKSEDTSAKSIPKSKTADKKEENLEEELALLRTDITDKLVEVDPVTIERFFKEKLGALEITDESSISKHLNNVMSTAGLRFILIELLVFIDEPRQKQKMEEEKSDTAPDEEQEPEEQEPEEQEQSQPEMNPDDVSKLEDVKVYLIQFIDRLTLLESKVQAHGEDMQGIAEEMNNINSGIAQMQDSMLEAITIHQRSIDEKLKNFQGGGGGTYTVKYDKADVPDKEFKEMAVPKAFSHVMDLAVSRINIFLHGPTGSGKTTLAKMVADALGQRFCSLSCSEGMDDVVFTGSVLPIGEGGVFEYLPSTFVDFYENGGVFLIDEMCAADANLLITPNSAIGNDYFYLPTRWKNPLVKRHPDFVCLAADNTQGMGGNEQFIRNQLDMATLDRFKVGMVFVGYDKTVETKIIDPNILAWGRMLRRGIEELGMTRSLSTRVMGDLTKLKEQHSWSMKKLVDSYFNDWSKDNRKNIENWQKREIAKLEEELKKSAGV